MSISISKSISPSLDPVVSNVCSLYIYDTLICNRNRDIDIQARMLQVDLVPFCIWRDKKLNHFLLIMPHAEEVEQKLTKMPQILYCLHVAFLIVCSVVTDPSLVSELHKAMLVSLELFTWWFHEEPRAWASQSWSSYNIVVYVWA